MEEMASKGQELVLVLRDLTLDARKILEDPARLGNNGARGAGGVERRRFSKGWGGGGARPQVAAAAGVLAEVWEPWARALLQEGEAPARARGLLSNTRK